MGRRNASPARTRRKLIKTGEAAEYLGRSMKTIRRYVAEGELTGYRIATSRLIMLDLEEVEALAKKIPNARS